MSGYCYHWRDYGGKGSFVMKLKSSLPISTPKPLKPTMRTSILMSFPILQRKRHCYCMSPGIQSGNKVSKVTHASCPKTPSCREYNCSLIAPVEAEDIVYVYFLAMSDINSQKLAF